MSAKVTYAVSLYRQLVDKLGPRAAYESAVKLAGLRTASEREKMRNAIVLSEPRRGR
jgi:hypothetical protein